MKWWCRQNNQSSTEDLPRTCLFTVCNQSYFCCECWLHLLDMTQFEWFWLCFIVYDPKFHSKSPRNFQPSPWMLQQQNIGWLFCYCGESTRGHKLVHCTEGKKLFFHLADTWHGTSTVSGVLAAVASDGGLFHSLIIVLGKNQNCSI